MEEPLHPDYPLPDVDDPIMRPFWEGCQQRKLMLQRDRDTGAVHWPPKPMYWTGGEDRRAIAHPTDEGRRATARPTDQDPHAAARPTHLEWFESSGRGEIYSYVIGYDPFLPAFKHLLPLVMVLVQLDEGPRLVGYMVNCKPEEVDFGTRVRVVFKQLTDRVTLPVWEIDR